MNKAMLKKAAFMSLRIVVITAVIGIAYGSRAAGSFTLSHAFMPNFWVGVTILSGGLLIFITPTALQMKKSRLIDHSTFAQRFAEERDGKRVRAYELIFIGIFNITITGAIQLAVWMAF